MTKTFRLHHPHIFLSRFSRALRNRSSPCGTPPTSCPPFPIVVRIFVNLVQALLNSSRSGGSGLVHFTTMHCTGTLPSQPQTTPVITPVQALYLLPRDVVFNSLLNSSLHQRTGIPPPATLREAPRAAAVFAAAVAAAATTTTTP